MVRVCSIIFILGFVACVKEVKFKADEIAPRIVVNASLSHGDTIRLHLSESREITYTGNLPNITNANAQLFDEDDNLLGTFIHDSAGVYHLNSIFPESGKNYTLNVTAPGLNPVKASTYIPNAIAISQIDTNRIGDKMNYAINFSDNVYEKNYYVLTMQIRAFHYMESGYYGAGSSDYFCTNEIIVQNGSSNSNGNRCEPVIVFSDETFNGQNKTILVSQDIYAGDCTQVSITLKSITEDYFKYVLTSLHFNELQPDPFSQPVQVYSNIENGFGIFGGISHVVDTITWK